MAKRFRSDPDASAAGKKRAKENANKHFEKKNGGAEKKEPRTLIDLTATNGLKAADIRRHFQTLKGLKLKAKEANSHYSNARKRCKEDGFDPAVMSELMKREEQDPLEVALYFKQLSAGAAAVGVEMQMDMFDKSGISREAQIFDDGVKAGLAARSTSDNPHNENTDAGQTWLAGWHAGQRTNMNFGTTPDEDTTTGVEEMAN